jgi:hypothetical protein
VIELSELIVSQFRFSICLLAHTQVLALSRTYAYAIAGTPLAMKFNPQSNHFLLQYILNGAISQPTEIYLNEKWRYED